MSRYRLQIIDAQTGEVVIGWQPNDRVETELSEELLRRVKDRGVGLFRTEAQVLASLRQCFSDMLYELKGRV